MKKIFVLIMAILMCFFTFSCNGAGDGVSTTALTDPDTGADKLPDTEPSDEVEDEVLSLIKDGKSEYKIIRPEECSDFLIFTMNVLRDAVSDKLQLKLSVGNDWVRDLEDGESYESDAHEILIGLTNRAESREAHASLSEGEYIIKAVGNKLVLVGYNDYLTNCAVDEFIEKYVNSARDGNIELALPTEEKGTSDVVTVGDTDATVRAMTFNVLGSSESPDTRIPYIIAAINKYEPGIIGFQECNKNQHNKTVDKLEGYSVATKTHENSTTVVYTPIVYKTDKYELIDAGAEWLDSRYTKTNTKSLAFAVFKDIASGEIFAVINIHGSLWLKNNYELPEGKTDADMAKEADEVWKADNVRQMNDCMQNIYKKHGEIPVIWMGDFNFSKTHAAYSKATEEYGMTDAEYTASVSRDDGIKTYHSSVGTAPTNGDSIDHIFGNSQVSFRVHVICRSEEDILASDHCPVYADFLFE